MDPIKLIEKHYGEHETAKLTLLAHSHQVAHFATAIATNLSASEQVDVQFIHEAALLHDIGIIFTNTPKLGCHGEQPYITHGILGAELLEREGLPRHALVCERHIGVGLSLQDIDSQHLPLPRKDMRPASVEERIIAYADLFFSKTRDGKRTADMVRASLAKYGEYKVDIFNNWHKTFNPLRGEG